MWEVLFDSGVVNSVRVGVEQIANNANNPAFVTASVTEQAPC